MSLGRYERGGEYGGCRSGATTWIIHLSDLHLTAGGGDARSEPKLFGKLTGMNAAFRGVLASGVVQRADWVLITGDITDSG